MPPPLPFPGSRRCASWLGDAADSDFRPGAPTSDGLQTWRNMIQTWQDLDKYDWKRV